MTAQALVLTDQQRRLALRAGRLRETELGLEKRCSVCGDYWPADTEFFYAKGAGLMSCCKACYVARRWPDGRRSDGNESGGDQ